MNPRVVRQLSRYSHKIGSEITLVQGPGGNTSIKAGDNIWVKASGKWLANAEIENIFCFVDKDEPKIDLVPNSKLRPSIEVYFHTMLPMKAIFHVHSLGSLTWALRKCGQEYLKRYFPELLWVNYQKPGIDLAESIIDMPYLEKHGAVLQNHGMIIWEDSLKSCYKRLVEYERKLLELAVHVSKGAECHSIDLITLKDNQYFTPDHAVFQSVITGEVSGWESEALLVIQNAIGLIPNSCEVSYLSQRSINELLNWDEEEFRRRLNE